MVAFIKDNLDLAYVLVTNLLVIKRGEDWVTVTSTLIHFIAEEVEVSKVIDILVMLEVFDLRVNVQLIDCEVMHTFAFLTSEILISLHLNCSEVLLEVDLLIFTTQDNVVEEFIHAFWRSVQILFDLLDSVH